MTNVQQTHNNKKSGFPLLQLALGAALAAGAGYYFTHKEEVDQNAKKHIERLAKKFEEKRPVIEKKVKKVWGEVSKQAIATYMDVRAQILHELEAENLQKNGKMIKEQYEKIVAAVIKKAQKSGYLTPATEKKLMAVFNMDWAEIRGLLAQIATESVKKTAEMVRQASTQKKIKKVKNGLLAATKVAKSKKSAKKIVKKKK